MATLTPLPTRIPRAAPLSVNVTEADLDAARREAGGDPLAMALNRTYPGMGRWYVGCTQVYLDGEPAAVLPYEARRMLDAYDWDKSGYPMQCTLNVRAD